MCRHLAPEFCNQKRSHHDRGGDEVKACPGQDVPDRGVLIFWGAIFGTIFGTTKRVKMRLKGINA